MKKIFIIENFFISWFANEKVCDFFVIENSEIDVVSLCSNMNWLFFFHLWQWNSDIFFMIAYEFRIFLKAKKWTCISKKRIDCFWKFIRNWMKIFLHFIDCEKWNVLKTEKKLKKKSIINNLIDLNEFRLFIKLLFFWIFILSCFKLLFSSI